MGILNDELNNYLYGNVLNTSLNDYLNTSNNILNTSLQDNIGNINQANQKQGFNWAGLVAPTVAGLSAALQSPGTYYAQASWKGNGLANTGLGYAENKNYANPYDIGQLTASIMDNKDWRLGKSNSDSNVQTGYNKALANLSGMGSNLKNWYNNKFKTIGDFDYLPTKGIA